MDGQTSDVYMYLHIDGFIECCGCRLYPARRYLLTKEAHAFWKRLGLKSPKYGYDYKCPKFLTRSGAMQHLLRHMRAGHKVEWNAYDRLEAEKVLFSNNTSNEA